MTTHQAAADISGRLSWLAEQMEGVLEQAGRRGMSPAAAARTVRRRKHTYCTTTDARLALAWLTGRQYAHTVTGSHPDRYFSGRDC